MGEAGGGGANKERAPAQIGRAEVRELFDRLVDPELGLCAHDSRFGEAQLVEQVAAWGAGRLSVQDIETLTGWFLNSKRVVRLVNGDSTGRAPWASLAKAGTDMLARPATQAAAATIIDTRARRRAT